MNFENEKAHVLIDIKKFFGVEENTEAFKEIMAKLKELGLIIAGGAVISAFTGSKTNDLDFYLTRPDTKAAAKEFLHKWFPADTDPFESTNAITFRRQGVGRKKYTAQLITRFVGTPYEIMDWFDFTVTQGAYCFSSCSFYFGDRFLQDNIAKRLVYLGKSQYPICALYRTEKYKQRGYTCKGSTLIHIALSIVKLDIQTYKQLKEQLMGIDTMFLQDMLSGPTFDDALPVDYAHFISSMFDRLNHEIVSEEE